MLSIMRKQARSWMIKIILFAIVIVFVFWGVGGFDTPQDTKVAEVNGEPISYRAYRQNYDRLRDQYRQAYGGALDEQTLRAFRINEQALNQLIDRAVMLQEARRLNVQVTESAVDQAIVSIPAFQSNGAFDEERAGFILSQNRISTTEFRNIFREDLMIDKLRALVLEGVTVSEDEAREWYDWYNSKVDLNYLLFGRSRYEDIHASDDQISDYFQENGDRYRTAPQVKVSYLHFDPNAYKERVTITDERISRYYQDHQNEFSTEKAVEARHILFKLDEDADEQVVEDRRQEAEAVSKRAAAGESFEELAKTYSEGPTREQGGYLGAFRRDEMVKPFADRAFAMNAGEVSEPVRSRFGWHVIKVENVNEAEHRSLEAASDSIRAKLTEEEARILARSGAESIYDATFDGDDLSLAAQSHKIPVHTTDHFSTTAWPQLEGADNPQPFVEMAFELGKMAISEPLELGDGYYVLQVIDRIEAAVPPLENVMDRVRADVTAKLRDEQAKADAENALDALKSGQGLPETAAQFGLEPGETGFFKRSEAIPGIGYEPEMIQAAFALQSDQPVAEQVFQGSGGWYAISLKDRKSPDEEGFVEEKEMIMQRLPEQKKQKTFDQWLADLKARGRIQIEHALIQ